MNSSAPSVVSWKQSCRHLPGGAVAAKPRAPGNTTDRWGSPGPGRLASLALSLAFILCPAAVVADSWEQPASLAASQVLTPKQMKGAHHIVGDQVTIESYYYIFALKTDYGSLEPVGLDQLLKRLREMQAIATLREVEKSDVFVDAAARSLKSVGDSLTHLAKDPEGTAKGLGKGIKRFSINLGRKSKRAMSDLSEETAEVQQGDELTADDAEDAANAAFGVNKAARNWARKLEIDPYSRNPILQEALLDVAQVDAAGHIAAKVVVPIPTVVSATSKVVGVVWDQDPEALRKTNEASLRSIGTSDELAALFFRSDEFTLTDQARFATALAAVGARGLNDYVDAARRAESPREAVFYVESAEMLQRHHSQFPVSAILTDSLAVVALSGERASALFPVDHLAWTEHVAEVTAEISERVRKELGASALEIRLTGQASSRARAEIQKQGWALQEGVSARPPGL